MFISMILFSIFRLSRVHVLWFPFMVDNNDGINIHINTEKKTVKHHKYCTLNVED